MQLREAPGCGSATVTAHQSPCRPDGSMLLHYCAGVALPSRGGRPAGASDRTRPGRLRTAGPGVAPPLVAVPASGSSRVRPSSHSRPTRLHFAANCCKRLLACVAGNGEMERCDQRASLAAPGPTETVVSGLGFLYAASILQDGCNNSGQHWERGGPPAGPGPSPQAVHLLRAVNRASQISTNPPGSAGRRVQGRKSPAETNLAAAPRRSRPRFETF